MGVLLTLVQQVNVVHVFCKTDGAQGAKHQDPCRKGACALEEPEP